LRFTDARRPDEEESPQGFFGVVHACRTAPKAAVWAGIGAYRLTVDGTVEKIRLARQAGAAGILVFSHESLARGDMDRLRQQAFARARPPRAGSPSAR
jgi:predicted NUDIX family NTP pyrophosphohydrolase